MNMIDLLENGMFCGIRVGAKKSEIIDAIGEPPGWRKSDSPVEVDDYFMADMWGYGAWTLYFEDDVLDAITYIFGSGVDSELFFQVDGLSFLGDEHIDSVANLLSSMGVSWYELPKNYSLYDSESGIEIKKIRRGRSMLLIGDSKLGRISFDQDSGAIKQLSFPFCAMNQSNGLHYLEKWRHIRLV
jgi:hypothetical protein